MKNLDLIKWAKEQALAGHILDKESIVTLLNIDPLSKDCQKLGETAREVSSILTKDRAYLWAAIGMDFKSCPMNCDFCSLGEKWGLVHEEKEFSPEEVIALIKNYAAEDVRWIVLRTTEYYSLDILEELIKRIRREAPGEYELGLNVGEFEQKTALKLQKAGINFIYHSLRLREGINTIFDPQDRLNTLQAVKDSPLDLVFLTEPVGIEHTNEEIADNFLTAVHYGAKVSGCMARVPVPGTPLGELPALSPERVAQIAAITRLAGGNIVNDICVHPANQLAMEWGANVAVVETGSVPRNENYTQDQWQGFDPQTAKEWFKKAGYNLYNKK
ncbi:MAG: radical SAM protein [Clostridiales bacterium]